MTATTPDTREAEYRRLKRREHIHCDLAFVLAVVVFCAGFFAGYFLRG